MLVKNTEHINAENNYDEENYSSLNPISVIQVGNNENEVCYYYSEMGFNEGPSDYIVNEDDLFASVEEIDGVEIYNIYDSSKDTGKVAYRTVKKSYLSGYQARTVWDE